MLDYGRWLSERADAMRQWLAQHRRPMVNQERVLSFGHGTDEMWELVIRGGQVFSRWAAGDPDHEGRVEVEYVVVALEAGYLEQRWFFSPERGWLVSRPPRRIALLFYDIAMVTLPYWEASVHYHYSKSERKRWSHHGATAEGDLGNHVYWVVVELCLILRSALGAPRLWTIDHMNMESRGDVLEGIMGLQHLGYNWDPNGVISEISIEVKNLWNTPNLIHSTNQRHVLQTMYGIIGFASITDDILYERHLAKVAMRTGITLAIGRAIGWRAASLVYSFDG